MRVFKNAWFRRFARKQRIGDDMLLDAISRAEAGLIDADLGAGLIKQRVSREGAGKSGGYRTLVAFRTEVRAVFVYGFAKSERENIDEADERELKKLARLVLGASDDEMDRLVAAGKFDEVKKDGAAEGEDLPQ